MNKTIGGILKISLSLGLGLLIIWLTFRKLTESDIQQIKDAFMRANYLWLGLAPIVGMISNFFRSERWRMMLEPLGKNPGRWNTYFAVLIMYAANLLFPRLGEVLRCTILARYEAIPVDRSIGTMVTERVMDVISILLVGLLLMIMEYDKINGLMQETFAGNNNARPFWQYIVLAGIVVSGLLFLWWMKKNPDNVVVKKTGPFIKGMWDGLLSVRKVKNKPLLLLHSFLIWFCYWLMIYLSFNALTETSALGIWAGMGCLFFGGFAMAATQGGIGVYPLVIQKMLELYAISGPIGYAFGWMVWTMQTLAVVIGGLIALVSMSLNNKKLQ